jgi:hypothetical protein
MGLLDEAIRQHLDLKRRRGADPAEIERAERDALGPVRRDPVGSDVAEFEHATMPDGDAGYEEESAYDHGFEEPRGLEEPPQFDAPVASEPPVAPPPAAAEPPVAPPPELEYTLDQETEVWDEFEPDAPGLVDAQHRGHAPGPAESLPVEEELPRAADPLAEEPIAQAPPEPYAAPAPPDESYSPPAPPEQLHEPEPRELDPEATRQYTTEPQPSAPPPPADPGPAEHEDPLGSDTAEYDLELAEGEGEDVLEETPEFLQDTPDHDRLWFEQRPPKDFDFDE